MRDIPENFRGRDEFDADDRNFAKLHNHINEYQEDPDNKDPQLIQNQINALKRHADTLVDIPTPADARELHQFHRGHFYHNWERRFHQLGQIGVIGIPNTTFEEWMVYFQEWANAFVDDYNKFQDLVDEVIDRLYNRDIATTNTNTVDLTSAKDWKNDSIMVLQADVNISKAQVNGKNNAINAQSDGIFAADLQPEIDNLQNEINQINDQIKKINDAITNINNEINDIKNEIQNIYKMLQNDYSYVSRDALKITTYNGWVCEGQPLDMSYVKAYGSVTCHFHTGYTVGIGFNNDDIQNNFKYAGPGDPSTEPKSAIFSVSVDNSKLPDEIKDLDFGKILSVGECNMQQFAGLPDPNTFSAVAGMRPVTGYQGVTCFVNGMNNGYSNRLGTTTLMQSCHGILLDASITFEYPTK